MTYMPNRKKTTTTDWTTIKGKSKQTIRKSIKVKCKSKTKSLLVNRQDIYVNKTLFWRLNAKECIQTKTLLFKPNRTVRRSFYIGDIRDLIGQLWVSVHDIFSLSLCYPDMEPVLYSNKSPVEYTVYLVSLR